MRSQKSLQTTSNAAAERVGLEIRNGAKRGDRPVPLGKFLGKRWSPLVRTEQAQFNLFKMGLKGVINLRRSRGSAENSIWSLLHLFQVLSLICFSCLYPLWSHTNAIKQKSFCRGWVAGIGWLYAGAAEAEGREGAAGVIAADSPRSPPDWHRKSIQRGCLRGACQIDSVNV